MRVRKIYLSSDNQQFPTRMDVIKYEAGRMAVINFRERNRAREERRREKESERTRAREERRREKSRRLEETRREKERVRAERKLQKETELKNRLTRVFGESITPMVNLIVQNKQALKDVLSGRRRA
jgi:hypothetical protein